MKLSIWTVPYRTVKSVLSMIVLLTFASSSAFEGGDLGAFLILMSFLGVFLAGSALWYYLVWKRYEYFVEDDSIRINQGVIQRKEREIPSRRIQNVDVRKNIVHRALGIARVDIETAGGGSTEASLRYVDEDDVDHIRKGLKEGEKVESEEERDYLYEISMQELSLLGVVSVNLQLLLVILGIFGTTATLGGMAMEDGMSAAIVLGFVVFATLVFAFVSSFVSSFTRFYGFRLWEEDGDLRYERGLLNRAEGTIPLEKVQNITVEENVLKRLTGYATLKIETAGYAGEKAIEQGSEAAIPLAKRSRIERFLKDFRGIEVPEINRVTHTAMRRYMGRYALLLGTLTLITTAAAARLSTPVIYGLFPLLFSPCIMTAAHLKWKHRGYALSDRIVTRNGFWNRSTIFTPYYRVQNLVETQTVLQRRWHLSSLTVDIAGSGMFSSTPRAVDMDTENLREFRDEIYRRFQDSL